MIRLKQIREKHKISQEKLAEFLGVERPTISRWENGINEPPLHILLEISRMFTISVDWLLGNDSEQKSLNDLSMSKALSVSEDSEIFNIIKKLDKDKKNALKMLLVNNFDDDDK